MELNEKWKLTTQNNAYLWEGNQTSKQNRYPCVQDLAPSLLAASGEWPHHGPVCGDQDRPNEMMFEQVMIMMIIMITMQ